MSVYCLGKVGGSNSSSVKDYLIARANEADLQVRFELEAEDLITLQVSANDISFTVSDKSGSDIVIAFNQAFEEGRKACLDRGIEIPTTWPALRSITLDEEVVRALLTTRMGKFISSLFEIKDAEDAGLAIFDGGIELLIDAPASECFVMVLKTLLLPWDGGPNALFVWKCSSH
jgi:hypothetical protein